MVRTAARRAWLLVALPVIASCTSPAPKASAEHPSPATRATLPAPVDEAYTAFWAAWTAANADSTYDLRQLDDQVMNPLVETLKTNLNAARGLNQVTRGAVRHDIRKFTMDGDAPWITDCVDVTDWRMYDSATGALVPAQIPGRRTQLTTLVMRKDATRLKATNMYVAGQC